LQASIKLSSDFDFIGLIKPQFEVGQHSLSASGVVTDWRERKRSIEQVIESAQDLGMTCAGITSSPIKGATGNQEYLIWLNKGGSDIPQWDGNFRCVGERKLNDKKYLAGYQRLEAERDRCLLASD